MLVAHADAQIPPGYYAGVDATNATTLRTTLHAAIKDHTKFPYTSSGTDTWNILEAAMEDPANPGNILDVYQNDSHPKQGAGNSFYEREHTWPVSYGFPNDGADNYPYTDCHMLWLCDSSYNGSRGNKPFRNCSAACGELPTVFNNGQGGGTGIYPGNSNWTSGSSTSGTWEVWIGRRGDVARALMYADVRYEGGVHGITGQPEPDLILTDTEALIAASSTGTNLSIAYMGMKSVLLQWNAQDPVDQWERDRNDAVYSFQGNRNPFVDHPEWVDCLFSGSCSGGDMIPPAQPTGLMASAGDGHVVLDWDDNTEPDLAGYTVYRAPTMGGPYASITASLVAGSIYDDATATNGTTYYYVVSATDSSTNESLQSGEASATPMGGGMGGSGTPWINEIHYDNVSTDVGEFFEIAGPGGLDLTGYSVVGYNGNGGAVYDTWPLTGTLPVQGACYGTLAFPVAQMQNGSPDGLALVDPSNTVLLFLSYEGTFTAVGGAAGGMLSTDIGVVEDGTTPIGFSLQLTGTGSAYGDFTWTAPQAATNAAPNAGQTFTCGAGNAWVDLGFGLAGVSGVPLLEGTGTLLPEDPYTIALSNARPSATAGLFLTLASTPVPFKGGTLVPFPSPFVFILATNPSGEIALGSSTAAGTPAGIDLFVQYWIQDPAAIWGLSASNALQGTTH
ncbi:MAG: endonuclease [Planctomycetes bacterium]|nr:endonuclease [Planctomycetota bacterium]